MPGAQDSSACRGGVDEAGDACDGEASEGDTSDGKASGNDGEGNANGNDGDGTASASDGHVIANANHGKGSSHGNDGQGEANGGTASAHAPAETLLPNACAMLAHAREAKGQATPNAGKDEALSSQQDKHVVAFKGMGKQDVFELTFDSPQVSVYEVSALSCPLLPSPALPPPCVRSCTSTVSCTSTLSCSFTFFFAPALALLSFAPCQARWSLNLVQACAAVLSCTRTQMRRCVRVAELGVHAEWWQA